MSNNGTCPIWGTPAERSRDRNRDGENVISSRAGGRYFISGTAKAVVGNSDDTVKARLTTWIIDQNSPDTHFPEITYEIIEQVRQRPPLPVHERADRLLKYLTQEAPGIGNSVSFQLNDEEDTVVQKMLARTESINPSKELHFLLTALSERKWTEKKEFLSRTGTPIITVEGYTRLAELATKHVNSSQGFVAMWFDDSMTEAYENGIGPGIEDAGYSPRRIDEKPHVNKIDDEIIAEIRRSRFVVADFTHGDTGHRGGVYYEAGFAHGLGIPVFFTCRKDVLDKIHFDTRQYNHIVWETHEDLRKQLADRISRVIGDGPNKTPAAN